MYSFGGRAENFESLKFHLNSKPNVSLPQLSVTLLLLLNTSQGNDIRNDIRDGNGGQKPGPQIPGILECHHGIDVSCQAHLQ